MMIMILLLLLIILLVLNVTGQNALRGSLRGDKEAAAGGNSNPNRRRSKPKRQYDGKDPNLGNLLSLPLLSSSLSLS